MLKHICLYVKHTVPIDWHASLNLEPVRVPRVKLGPTSSDSRSNSGWPVSYSHPNRTASVLWAFVACKWQFAGAGRSDANVTLLRLRSGGSSGLGNGCARWREMLLQLVLCLLRSDEQQPVTGLQHRIGPREHYRLAPHHGDDLGVGHGPAERAR